MEMHLFHGIARNKYPFNNIAIERLDSVIHRSSTWFCW